MPSSRNIAPKLCRGLQLKAYAHVVRKPLGPSWPIWCRQLYPVWLLQPCCHTEGLQPEQAPEGNLEQGKH